MTVGGENKRRDACKPTHQRLREMPSHAVSPLAFLQ
jgi:hypothetical protein